MKAEELMKGNWVFSKRFQRPVQIVAVASRVLYYVDGVLRTENVGDVSPIPLSPEIMEKNWVGKWGKHSETIKSFIVPIDEHSNITFQVMSGSSEVFFQYHRCGADSCEFRKNINHVHQLQQIFTICGIEKEITLDGISVKEG